MDPLILCPKMSTLNSVTDIIATDSKKVKIYNIALIVFYSLRSMRRFETVEKECREIKKTRRKI